jgi:two-component system sensor histidine kinase QseC
VAWQQTTHKLELFDTQQMLFAKRLLTMDLDEIRAPERCARSQKVKHGRLDDDALAFAIYSVVEVLLLNDGENGAIFRTTIAATGLITGSSRTTTTNGVLWLTSPDGKYRVVVGQEWEYRQDMALDVVSSQLTPWLVALPVMLLCWFSLSRELRPLKKLAQTLRSRSPDAPTLCFRVPRRPLLDALNHFAHPGDDDPRARFTSDAAHELRSPLAALKVQTDVAQLSQDDPQAGKRWHSCMRESTALRGWWISSSPCRVWTRWITLTMSNRSRRFTAVGGAGYLASGAAALIFASTSMHRRSNVRGSPAAQPAGAQPAGQPSATVRAAAWWT